KVRKQNLLSDNKQEDKLIKQLEKKLFLNKRKNKNMPKSFIDEGLDCILQYSTFLKQKRKLEDVKTSSAAKRLKGAPENDESGSEYSEEGLSSDDESSTVPRAKRRQKDTPEDEEDDSKSAEGEDDESCDKSEDETLAGVKKAPAAALKHKDGTWEDIYGRLRDKDGNVVSQKYVPPAKRLQSGQLDSKKKEELARLKKQLKGLLNRLSQSTVQPIGLQIEELYRKHSNNDMNSSLNLALCESIVSPFLSPERLVMEHAMLVAYLHCNVGTEVGECMGWELVLTRNLGQIRLTVSARDRRFYPVKFKVIDRLLHKLHSRIVFDLIRKLAEAFTEKDVELILLILRSVGFVLRKRDPLALKETVLLLQQKSAQDANTQEYGLPFRFMMDILNAVRNNNIQKIPNCDPSMVEHASKVLRGLFRKGQLDIELNISLDDLLKAHERGKWWVVGSAWTGNQQDSSGICPFLVPASRARGAFEVCCFRVLNRADGTRHLKRIPLQVPCAADYLDASERILRLNLSPTQEREVCHVLLHCALKEKRHNPYYAFLAQFFVKRDRRFHMTLQCALWDKFKEVDKLSPTESSNLAEFIVALLSQEALSLSVLKTVHFVDMSPALLRFLRQLFVSLFVGRSEAVCEKVFLKVAEVPKLHLLREGVRLFLRHFFLRDADQVDPSLRATLEERVATAEDVLSLGDKKAVL
ncbi:sgd1p, putative, partial [Ixodes scapularis]